MPEKIRHGKAFWPGIEAPVACTYTVSHGISPAVAMLTCLPQAGAPALSGNLVLTDDVTTITIPDCKIDRLDVRRDGSGILWQISILDRRWRWRELGGIAGYFNQIDPHGIILPWTLRSNRDLCELCLLAMGERGYTIEVPTNSLTPANWDYTSPAQALSQLVEQLGCRIVYRLDTNTVHITPLGKGRDLPDGSIFSEGPALDSPERPDSIVLVGAPIRFQMRMKMEAVGKDWDGLYRPIDALSYRPAIGWEKCGPPVFAGIQATNRLTRLEAIALAQESVFRCYQVINIDPDGSGNALNVPGYGRIVRRQQLLLEDTKVEQVQPKAVDERLFDGDGDKIIKHFYNGFRRDVPAEVYGSYNVGRLRQGDDGEIIAQNTSPLKRIPISFAIDPIWHVITFSQYVYRIQGQGLDCKLEEPDLILETGCQVRDALTNQILRYTREFRFGPPYLGTAPLYIHHDDVVLNVVGDYVIKELGVNNLAEHRLTGIRVLSGQGFNTADTVRRAGFYLTGAAARYQLTGALQRTYNGLESIWLDGKIQQVTWSVGEPSGAVTQASLNTEHSVYVPPYPTRLKIEYTPAPPPAVVPPVPGANK